MVARARIEGQQLKRDEGCRATAYLDSSGVWTVGYGHNLAVPLSDTAMTQILHDDINTALTACARLEEWSLLSEPRQAVIANMIFNLGESGYRRFVDVRHALRQGTYNVAADAMLDSAWAHQVGHRAERLARQMRDDQWV